MRKAIYDRKQAAFRILNSEQKSKSSNTDKTRKLSLGPQPDAIAAKTPRKGQQGNHGVALHVTRARQAATSYQGKTDKWLRIVLTSRKTTR